MAISFISAGTQIQSVANPTPGLPSGYQAGDLLILITGSANTVTPTVSGYTQIISTQYSTNTSSSIFYKVATASETAPTVSDSNSSCFAQILCYRGASIGKIATAATAAGTSLATNTVTTPIANAWIVSFWSNNPKASTWSTPSGTTQRAVNTLQTGSYCGFVAVDEIQATAGVSTARTSTETGSGSVNGVASAFVLLPNTTQKTVFITSGTTYTIPSDYASLVSVEGIGGGGNGDSSFAGGGGGAYAKSTNITGLYAGLTTYVSIGAANGDTWFNTSNSAPTLASTGVLAKAGQSASSTNGGAGGASGSSIGNTKYSGGSGGTSTNYTAGGGGAAGAGGAGGNGSNDGAVGGSGGGGGASLNSPGNGGSTSTGSNGANGGNGGSGTGGGVGGSGNGGNGTAGTGGGGAGGAGGGSYTGGNGATGSYWTATAGGTAGSGGGGGGGGGFGAAGGAGGLYGGGGGGSSNLTASGAQGIIVFTYNAYTNITKKTVFITSGTTYTIPSDFQTLISVEGIGAGGANPNPASYGGAGGGAYAKSISVSGLTPGATAYCSVGAGTTSGAGGDTWFNISSNAAPTLTTQGILAKGGQVSATSTGGLGGQASASIGDVKFSGGNGGAYSSGAGGSGGAAAPGGVGGNGSSASGTGGRGAGGGGASASAAGNNATNASGSTGGNGGNGGGGTGGGAGSTTTGANGTSGTGGGGGGGGSIGGAGGSGIAIWTQTSNSATAGAGGGCGAGSSNIAGGGGLYGGGGGYGSYASAQGIIVFTYNAATSVVTNTSNFFLFFM